MKTKILMPILMSTTLATALPIVASCGNDKELSKADFTTVITKKYTDVFSKYTPAQLTGSTYTVNSTSFFCDDNGTKLEIKKDYCRLYSEAQGGERNELYVMVKHPQYSTEIGFLICPSLTMLKQLMIDIPESNYKTTFIESSNEWKIKVEEKQPSSTGVNYLQVIEYHISKSTGIVMKYQVNFIDKDTKADKGVQQLLTFDKFELGK